MSAIFGRQSTTQTHLLGRPCDHIGRGVGRRQCRGRRDRTTEDREVPPFELEESLQLCANLPTGGDVSRKDLRDRRSENMPMNRNLRQVGFYLRDHGVVEPCLACRNTDDGRACHQEGEPDEGGGHGSFEHEGRNEGA